jgi:hypothetical protein
MKPNSQLKSRSGRTDETRLPLVDSNYHVVTLPNLNGGCARHPSFRNISGEYFRNEARNEFQLELTAFAAIILTATIPILSNLHALADFLRAIGSF